MERGKGASEDSKELRRRLTDLFGRHRDVHPYGLADLESPYWERSRWWLDGDAAVGVIEPAGAPEPLVYAISAEAQPATLDLLDRLSAERALPAHFVITGPVGLTARLAGRYRDDWNDGYVKMVLVDQPSPGLRLPGRPEIVPLDRRDLDPIGRLRRRDPQGGTYFTAELLDDGFYRGVRAGDELVAIGGTHVVSRRHRVAAIGNILVDPDHRRMGLGAAVTSAVIEALRSEIDVIGLNTRNDNRPAHDLYARLGFIDVHTYEEAELWRRS